VTIVDPRSEATEPRDRAASVAATEPRYAGLVTRAIAFALDAAVIDIVAIVVAVGVALILSVLHIPKGLRTVLLSAGGVAFVLWTIGYFVGFWSTTGQTPGGRAMGFRVVSADAQALKPRRALLRVAGLLFAALPLFAGYVMILFDDRRRGLQDRLARTLVIEQPTGTRLPTGRRLTGRSGTRSGRT